MKNSKFYEPPTLKERLQDLKYAFLFWKGRRKGMIHTRNIKLSDFQYIFFPKDFSEKYGYLGASVWDEQGQYFKALYPLVLALDYEAKPKWCPRWFLRFLDVFGNDRSIVRVRNRKLHNLYKNLTKGIIFWDWKTKWTEYDLRISISAPEHLQELALSIEKQVYTRGYRATMLNCLKDIKKAEGKYNEYSDIKLLEKLCLKYADKSFY